MNILRLKLIVFKLILVGFSIFLMNPAMADETGAAAENNDATNPAMAVETEAAAENNDAWFTRRQKTIMLNVGAMGGVLLHGFINWDYGKDSFHFNNEGGFGRTTKYGGMDKLGHFWSSYSGSHLLGYVYREWGYSDTEANLYGALSSFGIQSFMEIADGFSGHGFSYEDFLANTVGACAGYIWGKYPRLAEKIDFRIEYRPDFNSNDLDLFTNYENQRFLIAIKAEGFKVVTNPILKYGELHVGYYAHGYDDYDSWDPDDDRKRTIFVGIGFNVTRFVQKWVDMSVFNYIQIPYTSINFDLVSD